MRHRKALDENHQPGLRPPQFSLTGLFWGVSGLMALLATFKLAGPISGAVALLAALAVLAHVAANSLGTQLRNSTDQTKIVAQHSTAVRAEPRHFATTTRLAHRVRMGWPILVLTGLCAAGGAYFGGNYLAEVNASEVNTASLTLAFVSCGVLGAMLGFALSMFLRVAVDAWMHAHRHE